MHSRSLCVVALAFSCVVACAPLEAATPIRYEQDVAPIFRASCAGCHNDVDLEGKLSLETFAQLRQGGEDHGDPIHPGDPDASLLIKVLDGRERPRMPPKDEPPLPPASLEVLKRWIREGAHGPEHDASILKTLVTPQVAPATTPPPVTAVASSPDGTRLALAYAGRVEIRDANSPALHRSFSGLPGKVNAVHFSPDGRRLVVATGVTGLHGVACLYDLSSGALLREFGDHADILYDAEFSPDGALLATAGYDRIIRLWNVEDGTCVRTIDVHKGAVFDLAWHPRGAVLASASADETVKLWRVADGQRLDTLNQPQGEMLAVHFTGDGEYIIAAGADKRIHLWRFVSRDEPALNPVLHSRFAHESPVNAICLSADGRHLLSAAEDRSLKLWSVPELELQHAYPPGTDIATALVAIPGTDRFFAARMDGTSEAFALEVEAPTEPQHRTVASPSPTATAAVAEVRSYQESEPNDAIDQAAPVTVAAEITGAISKPGDADLYRFHASAGEVLLLEVNAARSKSKLDSRLEILHADGRPVEQVVLQATRDSWFTFRGKDSDTSDDFRLHNWAEMELDEYLYANGEVVQLWLYPRGPDSGFKVYPGGGRRRTFFSTTPVVHALGQPCYIVRPLPPGSDPTPNGLPVFRLNYVNDDDPLRLHGVDASLLFTAPADGDFIVRVTDVRGFGEETDFQYSLAIRPPKPDFSIAVGGTNPKVSPGSGREITFKATRREGFEGPIHIHVSQLPPGFTFTSPVEIEAGQDTAIGVLYAAPDAMDPPETADQQVKVTALATLGANEVSRDLGSLGNVQLGDPAKVTVEILASSPEAAAGAGAGAGPGTGDILEFSLRPGETLTARVRAVRHDFAGRIELGGEDSGRNLPHGVYVDNIGLNGLLIVEGQTEREFFITASPIVKPCTRLFHLRAAADGGQASRPAILRILPRETLTANRSPAQAESQSQP